jgi:hypothetical protein
MSWIVGLIGYGPNLFVGGAGQNGFGNRAKTTCDAPVANRFLAPVCSIAERPRSAAGAAGEIEYHEAPSCGPGLLRRLVRPGLLRCTTANRTPPK